MEAPDLSEDVEVAIKHKGPTPTEAREITDRLCRTLMQISHSPKDGGPATLSEARRMAREVAAGLPMRYLIRPDEWQPAERLDDLRRAVGRMTGLDDGARDHEEVVG